ncbi:MAG: hypothetical protein OXE77_08050 [Flavobacteriaceae bacterium]|nr:hypothetical protein [Flavobacteriaceae bacterium]
MKKQTEHSVSLEDRQRLINEVDETIEKYGRPYENDDFQLFGRVKQREFMNWMNFLDYVNSLKDELDGVVHEFPLTKKSYDLMLSWWKDYRSYYFEIDGNAVRY